MAKVLPLGLDDLITITQTITALPLPRGSKPQICLFCKKSAIVLNKICMHYLCNDYSCTAKHLSINPSKGKLNAKTKFVIDSN